MFGELALVDGSPRSACAYAKTDVVLTIVTSEQVSNYLSYFNQFISRFKYDYGG